MPLFEKMVETISRYNMFGPGIRLGIAVSGGADSVCLSSLLAGLAPQWNLSLALIHINHHLRGAESDGDEEFVRLLAERLRVPVFVRDGAVGGLSGNLEQAARQARLSAFKDLIQTKFDRIATGHTQSDQAETVLYRILRGAYTTGLAGIRPVTSSGLVRPLLNATRTEVRDFLRSRALPWREDSSNADLSFDRNRIRRVLLPELMSGWNPNLPGILARHAELAREDDEYWESEVDRFADSVLSAKRPGEVIADVRVLGSVAPAMRRRVVRRAIASVRGDLRQIDFRHIDAVLGISAPGAEGHARVQIPGVDVMRSFEWLRLTVPGPVPRPEFVCPVEVPDSVTLPLDASILSLEVIDSEGAGSGLHDTLNRGLDGSLVRALGVGLQVRNWQPGDRFRRIGHSHQQKLKELFHQFRVPLWERRAWPVLTGGDRILWAKRFGVAADFAATASTKSIIQVRHRNVESGPPSPASL
jgi:tRNA(Ile)-lysidine synthase